MLKIVNLLFCNAEFLEFLSKLKDVAAAHKRRLEAAISANAGAVMCQFGNALVSHKSRCGSQKELAYSLQSMET